MKKMFVKKIVANGLIMGLVVSNFTFKEFKNASASILKPERKDLLIYEVEHIISCEKLNVKIKIPSKIDVIKNLEKIKQNIEENKLVFEGVDKLIVKEFGLRGRICEESINQVEKFLKEYEELERSEALKQIETHLMVLKVFILHSSASVYTKNLCEKCEDLQKKLENIKLSLQSDFSKQILELDNKNQKAMNDIEKKVIPENILEENNKEENNKSDFSKQILELHNKNQKILCDINVQFTENCNYCVDPLSPEYKKAMNDIEKEVIPENILEILEENNKYVVTEMRRILNEFKELTLYQRKMLLEDLIPVKNNILKQIEIARGI